MSHVGRVPQMYLLYALLIGLNASLCILLPAIERYPNRVDIDVPTFTKQDTNAEDGIQIPGTAVFGVC